MAIEFCVRNILLEFAVLLAIFFDWGSCELVEKFGILNHSVTLSPVKNGEFKDITWKKGKDKVAEWQEGEDVTYFGSFTERAILDQSGNFTILNLTASDEGQYEFESRFQKSETMFLYVLDNLPQPVLSCDFDGENITVSCNGPEDTRFLSYEWIFSGLYVNLSESKVQLTSPIDIPQSISCILKNPKFTSESSLFLTTCVPENYQARHRYFLIPAFVIFIIAVFIISRKSG